MGHHRIVRNVEKPVENPEGDESEDDTRGVAVPRPRQRIEQREGRRAGEREQPQHVTIADPVALRGGGEAPRAEIDDHVADQREHHDDPRKTRREPEYVGQDEKQGQVRRRPEQVLAEIPRGTIDRPQFGGAGPAHGVTGRIGA